MIDTFYKFTDEAEMLDVLSANGMTYTDDNGIHVSQGGHNYAAWVVGELQGYTGYHLNVRNIDYDLTALEPYLVNPQQPKVIWG